MWLRILLRTIVLVAASAAFFTSVPGQVRERYTGYCQATTTVTIDGRSSTSKFGHIYPSCTVTVYNQGTVVLATLYSDYAGTPLANPVTADATGRYTFVVATGRYDVVTSGAGMSPAVTTAGIWVEASQAIVPNTGVNTIPYLSATNTYSDSPFFRESANSISQRNSSNSQTTSFFHSYTDSSNNQGLSITHTSSSSVITTATIGTGADNLDLRLSPAGTGEVQIGTSNSIPGRLNLWQSGTAFKYVLIAPTTAGDRTITFPEVPVSTSYVTITSGGVMGTTAPITPGGSNGQLQYNNAGAFGGMTGSTVSGANLSLTGTLTLTVSSANALAVGPNGTTNPTFNIVTNVASAATGVQIIGRAAGASTSLAVISSGSNEDLSIEPKGTGNTRLATGLLQFAGSTASEPALRRNGSILEVRVADDSAYGQLRSGIVTVFTEVRLNESTTQLLGGSAGTFDVGLVRSVAGAWRVTDGSTGTGNFILGASTASVGTSGIAVLVHGNGTAPSTQPADEVQVFATDFAAGDSRLRIVSEAQAGAFITIGNNAITFGVTGSADDTGISRVSAGVLGITTGGSTLGTVSAATGYLGNGVTNVSPASGVLNATGGSGSNITGANVVIAAGKGTGNAAQSLATLAFPLFGASGTTLQSLSTGSYPIISNNFVQTTDVTVTQNTDTTILAAGIDSSNMTIEAGQARVGRTWYLRATGDFGIVATNTLTIKAKLAGSTVATIVITGVANDSGPFLLEATFAIIIAGTSGTFNCEQLRFNYVNLTAYKSVATAGQVTTIDFSTSKAIDITGAYSAVTGGNAWQVFHVTSQIIR